MMKLAKDKFKRSEIDALNTKIIDYLCEYLTRNKLSACTYIGNPSFRQKNKPPQLFIGASTRFDNRFYKHELNGPLAIRNHLQNLTKHYISELLYIHEPHHADFYFETFKKLSDSDKVMFIKLMKPETVQINVLETRLEIGAFTESEYWMHLRHVEPFDSPSLNLRHVRNTLAALEKKEFDSDEKIMALAYYVRYYKTIFKRTDVKSDFVRFLKRKIDEKHIPVFEDLLKININNQNTDTSLFEKLHQVQYINVSKEKIFNNLPLPNVKQISIEAYNSYLRTANNFLMSPKIKEQLNINRIDFCDFNASATPARIYFESTEKGFNENLAEIYDYLLRSCTHQYRKGTGLEINSAFNSALSHFFLNRELNTNNTEKNSLSKKINKL